MNWNKGEWFISTELKTREVIVFSNYNCQSETERGSIRLRLCEHNRPIYGLEQAKRLSNKKITSLLGQLLQIYKEIRDEAKTWSLFICIEWLRPIHFERLG